MRNLIRGIVVAVVSLFALSPAAYGQSTQSTSANHGSNGNNEKRLVSYAMCDDEGDVDVYAIKYDGNGRVVGILSDGRQVTYDWSNYRAGQVKGTFKSSAITLDFTYSLDKNGRVIKGVVRNEKGLLSTTDFEYNDNGYLVSVSDSGDKEKLGSIYKSPSVARFIYSNGALKNINVSGDKAGQNDNILYRQSENIPNKGGVFTIANLFPEMTTFSMLENLALMNLLGRPVVELPTSMSVASDTELNLKDADDIRIKWQLDRDGYPVLMKIEETVVKFVWE